jgi:putative redox protein
MTTQQASESAVVARAAGGRFRTDVAVRGGAITVDEPEAVGGGGAGPTPYELLSAGLAACTSMTLGLYAARKGWELPSFTVEVAHRLTKAADGRPGHRFERVVAFAAGPVDAERQAKLLEIADKCPVHRTLAGGAEIATRIGPPSAHAAGEPAARHEQEMERACET